MSAPKLRGMERREAQFCIVSLFVCSLRKPLPKSASPFGAPSARKFTQAREPECCGIFGEGTALPGAGAESLLSFLSSRRTSSPFARTACSHRRQSHVVGPFGDPQPRGREFAKFTRAHRILQVDETIMDKMPMTPRLIGQSPVIRLHHIERQDPTVIRSLYQRHMIMQA